MNSAKHWLFGLGAVTLLVAPVVRGDVWEIDPTHSEARFKIRHMMISNVAGQITGMKGTFDLDDADMSKSKAEATLDLATVNTNNAKRDEHLKTAEFFDVAKFPKVTFKSKKFTKAGDKWQLAGELTMHGMTKDLTLDVDTLTPPVKDPWGNTRRGLSATGKLDRKDWGLKWNKALDGGGVVIGEQVDVALELEMTAAKKGEMKDKKKS